MSGNPNITAAYWNDLVAYYNGVLGTSVPVVTVGTLIENEIFLDARNTWAAAAAGLDRSISLPDPAAFTDGSFIKQELWGAVGDVMAAQTIKSSASGQWFVPMAGVSKIMVNWLVGSGGGGGCGSEVLNGGGGGGGGAGGFRHWVEVAVRPNQKLSWTIASGGAGGVPGGQNDAGEISHGRDGGDAVLLLDGVEILRAGGGRGGRKSAGAQAPGGEGGVPNGMAGQVGPVGTNDRSSSYGGGGAPGPLDGCRGGAGGTTQGGNAYSGPSAGKAGVGSGSGGGGGGSDDRSGVRYWAGGAGQLGYIEFTFPSKGATGGTPAANHAGYTTTAPIAGTGGGGYTGGGGAGGRFGSDVNGINQDYL